MTWTEPIDSAPRDPHKRRQGPLADLELWAHCGPCSRWFFLPSDTIEAMATAHCPVCNVTPDAFEERYGEVRFPIEMG